MSIILPFSLVSQNKFVCSGVTVPERFFVCSVCPLDRSSKKEANWSPIRPYERCSRTQINSECEHSEKKPGIVLYT